MRSIKLILFLLLPIVSIAQGNLSLKKKAFVSLQSNGAAPAQQWNPIPFASFTPTTTLTYSGSGGVNSAAISGHTDIYLDGIWDRMRADGLVGSEGTPIRFVNFDATTIIGNRNHLNWEDWICIDAINNSNYVEFWGKSPTEPLWINGNDNGGFAWTGGANNSVVKGYNLLATDMGWASLFMNNDTNGYRYVEVIGMKNYGNPGDGEVAYMGNTSKSVFALFDSLYFKDIVGYNRGRDGLQLNNHRRFIVDGMTVHNVGVIDMSSQRALIQLQNARGILKNSIFHDAPSLGVVAGHGIVFYNNYFRWNSGSLILQDISSEYSGAPPEKVVGRNRLPIFFINCDFDPETSSVVITAQDSESDVVCINSNFSSNVSAVYTDSRSDTGTHSLLNIGATTGVTFTEPTYSNFDTTDHEGSGLAIGAYEYSKARGNRTLDARKTAVPTYDITGVTFPTGITANEGTAFEDLTLPAVVTVELAESFNVKLPVTWAEGSYDPDVQDTYTLIGTFELPAWYIVKNPGALTAEIEVEVIEPAFNPYTDIAWVAAFNPVNYNGTTWTNQGTGGNASQGSAAALPTAATGLSTTTGAGVVFTSSPQTGLQYGTGTVSEPFETWIEIITASSFTGTQRIYANGSATRVTINASGQLSVAGTSDVSTGVTLSTNTRYVLRIVNNGASSSITINNGTPTTFTITAQNGSSTPKLGHAYSAGSGHWNGTLGSFFQKSTALSGGDQTLMWTYFGYP